MRRIAILLSLTLFLASCRGPSETGGSASGAAAPTDSDVATRIELPDDPRVGPAPVNVFLLEDGEGVTGADVEVTGTMTHAGMTPVVRAAQESEPGLYRSDDFEFTMAGDWIVLVEADLPGGRTVRGETTVTVRQP